MNVETLIEQLQKMAQPTDEVTLIIEEPGLHGYTITDGIFTGKVIGTGTGEATGKCKVYGLA